MIVVSFADDGGPQIFIYVPFPAGLALCGVFRIAARSFILVHTLLTLAPPQ
jgi:hypothetical protein